MAKEVPKFADRLKGVREMREMTQAALGKASGMDQTAIAHFEAGRREPSLASLKALCKGALVSADYLLGLSERVL